MGGDYDVVNGVIVSPGRFEGECEYVPYYWDRRGGADEDDGDVLIFRVTTEEREQFPLLRHRKVVRLCQRDDGFVVEC